MILVQATIRGYLTRKCLVKDVRTEFIELCKVLDQGILEIDATKYSSQTLLRYPEATRTLPKIWRRNVKKEMNDISVRPSPSIVHASPSPESPPSVQSNVGDASSIFKQKGINFSSSLPCSSVSLSDLSLSLSPLHAASSLENMSTSEIERELLWARKALKMRRIVLRSMQQHDNDH